MGDLRIELQAPVGKSILEGNLYLGPLEINCQL